ncbi:MAG TPA: hypothetical protein VK961_26055 [Chthoniobacter sp.]|nr:hypothetical protein [Chthoniobacter sp.]
MLALLIFGIWKTQRSVQRSETVQERAFTVRTSIFSWFVGSLLLAAFLFLPVRALMLLLLPVGFGVLTMSKFLRDARMRLRREEQERVNLERMKRAN